jgi:hypothetical protein
VFLFHILELNCQKEKFKLRRILWIPGYAAVDGRKEEVYFRKYSNSKLQILKGVSTALETMQILSQTFSNLDLLRFF